MTCKACGYDDSDRPWLEPPEPTKPFIELGDVVSHKEFYGVAGHPRMADGKRHGMTAIFACPNCGTVRVEVKS